MGSNQPLTNRDIYEYWKVQKHSVKEVLEYVTKRQNVDRDIQITSFRSSLQAVEKKRKEYQRRKELKPLLEQYLNSEYILPQTKPKTQHDTTADHEEEPSTKKGKFDCECDTLKTVNEAVCKELHEANAKLKEHAVVDAKLQILKQKVNDYEPRKVNQKLKRKQIQLEKKTEVIQSLKAENKKLTALHRKKKVRKRGTVSKKVKSKKPVVCKVAKRRTEKKTVGTNTQDVSCKNCEGANRELMRRYKENAELRCKVLSLEGEVTDLHDQLAENVNSIINVKSDGRTYSDSLRETIYFCQSKNVAIDNMKEVVSFILSKLAGKTLSEFPDSTTCRRIVREMTLISRQQVAQALSGEEHTTLKYDGTSKAKEHWIEAQVATERQTFTIGLQKSVGGTADDYTCLIKDKIQSVGVAGEAHTGVNSTQDIIDNISNTMTDRHIVNKKANMQVQELKTKNKDAFHNFYCSLHPLDTFASSSVKEIKEYETERGLTHDQCKSFVHRGTSLTHAVIFSTSKIFHDEYGVPGHIQEYMKMKEIDKCLVEPNVGSRFHIEFHNAGSIYYLRSHIIEFVKLWGLTNKLQHAVYNDLSIPIVTDCLRALGLVGKYITGPWFKFAAVNRPVLDMNPFYKCAMEKLTLWQQDATQIMDGTAVLYDEDVERDPVVSSILMSTESDDAVRKIVERLCAGILIVCQRQLTDQLPGGIHANPSDVLQQEAKSCNSNNISGERVFGVLDSCVRRAPSARMDFHEAHVMYTENKTGAWLRDLEELDRSQVIARARKGARKEMKDSRMKEVEIRRAKAEQLVTKRKQLAEKEERNRETKENLLHDLTENGGLWSTREQMNNELNKVKRDTKKKNAIKVQIKVRKLFLNQTHEDQSIFAFSKNKKQLSLVQLRDNLAQLINCSIPDDAETEKINSCLKDPSVLENKYISHKWVEDQGEEKWYDGCIRNVVKESNVLEFKVEYYGGNSNLEEEVFMEFDELVTDLKNGDLIVLW